MTALVVEITMFFAGAVGLILGAAIWRSRLTDRLRQECQHPPDWQIAEVDGDSLSIMRSCGLCGGNEQFEPIGDTRLTDLLGKL